MSVVAMPADPAGVATQVECAPMTAATRGDALVLLAQFLRSDGHYLASSAVYGDGGMAALERALDLFLARPEIGIVWLARASGPGAIEHGRNAKAVPGAVNVAATVAVGACVACYAISTSRGSLVAKLDDVTIAPGWQGRGVGTAMLGALVAHLAHRGVTRIDTACHRDNAAAWRFYERQGFRPLDEERIALLVG